MSWCRVIVALFSCSNQTNFNIEGDWIGCICTNCHFRELCNLLCNSCCPVNSLPTMYVSSADNLCDSLDPDQAWQNVRPDLDPNYLNFWWYSWNNFSKNLILKKISRRQKSMQNYPACKELTTLFHSDGFCHTYWYKKYEIVDFVS